MQSIWQSAVPIAGLGAIGAFVFWSLMGRIVPRTQGHALNQRQSYTLALLAIGVVFAALIALLVAHHSAESRQQSQKQSKALIGTLQERYEITRQLIEKRSSELVGSGNQGGVAEKLAALGRFRASFDRLSHEAIAALESDDLMLFNELNKQIYKLITSDSAKEVFDPPTLAFMFERTVKEDGGLVLRDETGEEFEMSLFDSARIANGEIPQSLIEEKKRIPSRDRLIWTIYAPLPGEVVERTVSEMPSLSLFKRLPHRDTKRASR